jgi:hypothetical protein
MLLLKYLSNKIKFNLILKNAKTLMATSLRPSSSWIESRISCREFRSWKRSEQSTIKEQCGLPPPPQKQFKIYARTYLRMYKHKAELRYG